MSARSSHLSRPIPPGDPLAAEFDNLGMVRRERYKARRGVSIVEQVSHTIHVSHRLRLARRVKNPVVY